MRYIGQRSTGATTKNIRCLPTPFICGAINNIEINYRLKLTVINHFIFIISSSFRLSRLVVCVHSAHAPPSLEHHLCAIFANCVQPATMHRVLLKNITAPAVAAAISRSNVINASLPRGEENIISNPLAISFCGDADGVAAAVLAWCDPSSCVLMGNCEIVGDTRDSN